MVNGPVYPAGPPDNVFDSFSEPVSCTHGAGAVNAAAWSARYPSLHPTVIVAEADDPAASETDSGKSLMLASVGVVGSRVLTGIAVRFETAMNGAKPVSVVGPTVQVRSYFPVAGLQEPVTVSPLLWAKAEGARIAAPATTATRSTTRRFIPRPRISIPPCNS